MAGLLDDQSAAWSYGLLGSPETPRASLAQSLLGPVQQGILAGTYAPWQPTQLPADQEKQFQQQWAMSPEIRDWARSFQQRFGETPNPNDPGYDYRGAVMNGVLPAPDAHDGGFPHWGSLTATPSGRQVELKAPEHATRWKQTFMETFGVNPDETPPERMTPEQRQFVDAVYQRQLAQMLLRGPGIR